MRAARSVEVGIFSFYLAASALASLGPPALVSPGGVDTVTAAAELCPTFSWAGIRGARQHEIVVFQMASDEPAKLDDSAMPALRVTVAGSASSWTPAADRCLKSGTAYVWFVRALGRGGEAGEWSEGGMFRTPPEAVPEGLRKLVVQVVERYFAAASERSIEPPRPFATPGASERSGPATRPGWSRLGESLAAPAPFQPLSAPSAIRGELPDTSGTTTLGLLGISHSSAEQSTGLLGFASATSGNVSGVAGFARSPDGVGVLGENSSSTGGIGIAGIDGPVGDTEPSAGVVGITSNANGYGGFFWNDAGGDALVVAAPPDPGPIDVTFAVDVNGNVELDGDLRPDGVVQFTATDSPPGCDGSLEGAIYYDDSENWLCVCTDTGGATYGWRRADEPANDCST